MQKFNFQSAILLTLVIAAFVLHYISLAQTPYANGWDSYFYLLQTKSLIENSHLVSSRISIIYPILAGFKYLTGDYILGWKIFISTCAALAVFITFKIVNQLTSNKKAALLSATVMLWSPHLFYFSSQYGKNLLGFCCFLVFLLFILKRQYTLAIIFIAINLLVHKLTGALSVITLGLLIAFNIFSKQKRARLLLWGIIPIAALLFIPKIFGFDDFSRQTNFLTIKPQLHLTNFFSDFSGLISPIWKAEIIAINLLTILICIILIIKKNKSFNNWIIPILFFALNIPFIKWDLNGFSFRFFLFSILLGAIICGIAFAKIKEKAAYISIAILATATIFSFKAYTPCLHDPENTKFEKVIDRLNETGIMEQSELIIAHKGLAEFIKFNTGKDAMSWVPEYHIHNDSLWRVSAGISAHRLSATINPESIIKLGYNYCAIKESDWQLFLQYTKETNFDFYDDYTTWLNPNSVRPAYMKKYKRYE